MTVTFLNTAPPAVFCSPSPQTQKPVSLKHSPRFSCAMCTQHRLPLSAMKLAAQIKVPIAAQIKVPVVFLASVL